MDHTNLIGPEPRPRSRERSRNFKTTEIAPSDCSQVFTESPSYEGSSVKHHTPSVFPVVKANSDFARQGSPPTSYPVGYFIPTTFPYSGEEFCGGANLMNGALIQGPGRFTASTNLQPETERRPFIKPPSSSLPLESRHPWRS